MTDNTDLQPGEWRLYCPRCGHQAEKMAAQANQCPNCGMHMWLAQEPELPQKGLCP